MTAIEYMEKQLQTHRRNLERESARGVPEDMIRNIENKISFYEAAVTALKKTEDNTRGSYWKNICKMQKKQTEKGLKKYGQILEENIGMTMLERLEYLQEELIDGLMYIEHIKEMLTKEGSSRD
jgi:hypothetical protein